jgi:hypothetical protein
LNPQRRNNDESHENFKNSRIDQTDSSDRPYGLGSPPIESHQEGRVQGGPSTGGAKEGYPGWDVGEHPSKVRDHLREGSRARIPRLIDPSSALLEAFFEGDFEKAYLAALELQKAYRETLVEVSKLRFKLNFGTVTCQNCDGLKAGPGVTATCFQVQRCDFKNIKEGDEDPHQTRVINLLAIK